MVFSREASCETIEKKFFDSDIVSRNVTEYPYDLSSSDTLDSSSLFLNYGNVIPFYLLIMIFLIQTLLQQLHVM